MFRDYSFTLELDPRRNETTLVTCQIFYEPRGILARLMNAALMRRRFARVREDILGGLKELVGGTPHSPTDASVPASAQ